MSKLIIIDHEEYLELKNFKDSFDNFSIPSCRGNTETRVYHVQLSKETVENLLKKYSARNVEDYDILVLEKWGY